MHAHASQDLLASLETAEITFVDALRSLIKRNFRGASHSQDSANGTNSGLLSDIHYSRKPLSLSGPSSGNDSALQPLLQDLRNACETIEGSEEMRQLSTLSANDSIAIQEIRSRVEYLGTYFAGGESIRDARTALSLASLLGCTRRLHTLYRYSPFLLNISSGIDEQNEPPSPTYNPSLSRDHLPPPPAFIGSSSSDLSGNQIYHNLHRQAKSLQTTSAHAHRSDLQDSAQAVRAVEEAEVELLWGRVDDLLETISLVYQPRQTLSSPSQVDSLRKGADFVLIGPTPAMASDDSRFPTQHHLPEYSTSEPPVYAREEHSETHDEDRLFDDEKHLDQPSSSPRRALGTGTGVSDEKMHLDLDRMTSAIDRLYLASPQLSNQRADVVRTTSIGRAQLRESQLAKLGVAIETLSKGRLDDQRAVLNPIESYEAGISKIAQWKEKDAENRQASLQRLLDSIDKAASRTLNDQRASIR